MAKRGYDYTNMMSYAKGTDNQEVVLKNYIYGDFTQENTSARIAEGIDTLEITKNNNDGKPDGYTVRDTKDKNRRLIEVEDQGNIFNTAVVLAHESYRDGFQSSDNVLETRRTVKGHTEMAERMRSAGVDIDLSGLIGGELVLYDIARSLGDMSIMNKYADLAYDSSEDNWKLIIGENGILDWKPDGSLDFNFDLEDPEIAKVFNDIKLNPNIKTTEADGIGTISYKDMSSPYLINKIPTILGVHDPFGTKYIPGLGKIYSDFISNTKEKIKESADRSERIEIYKLLLWDLKKRGIQYGLGAEVIDPVTGITSYESLYMDCTALISYLTQTVRKGTKNFHIENPSFGKTDVAMPGDVFVYFATDSAGKDNNHAVIWLGGDETIESIPKIGPRYGDKSRLENDTYAEYTYSRQAYKLIGR
jgi:hypothetical protein